MTVGKVGRPVKIGEWASEDSRFSGEGYHLKLSRDSSKLLFLVALPMQKKDTKQKVDFKVFDASLEMVWAGRTSFKSERKTRFFIPYHTTHLGEITVDNAGRVFVVIATEQQDKDEKDPFRMPYLRL